jgi:hypothetical protein
MSESKVVAREKNVLSNLSLVPSKPPRFHGMFIVSASARNADLSFVGTSGRGTGTDEEAPPVGDRAARRKGSWGPLVQLTLGAIQVFGASFGLMSLAQTGVSRWSVGAAIATAIAAILAMRVVRR